MFEGFVLTFDIENIERSNATFYAKQSGKTRVSSVVVAADEFFHVETTLAVYSDRSVAGVVQFPIDSVHRARAIDVAPTVRDPLWRALFDCRSIEFF